MHTRRTTVRTGLVCGLATTALLTLGPATAAGTAPGIRVPNKGTLTVDGRGWGHGHGMSQYGAEGAARQGLSARSIIRFYYPHTTSGTVGGSVRVLLTAGIGKPTTVVHRRGLEVRDLARGTTRRVPTGGPAAKATRWRMDGDGSGGTRVLYRTHAWHVWRTLSGNGEFRSTGAPLTLVLGSSRVTYRGTLRSVGPISSTTHRITVNKVSLEGYVKGVVPREMPASWHQAALRAQAIAARTYAAFEARSSSDPRFDLCDSSSCQVYGGRSAEYPSSNRAVEKTARRVRLHHGAPAFTQFSASNGGWTAASSQSGQPYLDAHHDPYDGWSGNPVHTWSTSVTTGAIEKAYPALGNLESVTVTARDGNGQWNGRVLEMTLTGSQRSLSVSGDDFRARLGLRSTWFSLSLAG